MLVSEASQYRNQIHARLERGNRGGTRPDLEGCIRWAWTIRAPEHGDYFFNGVNGYRAAFVWDERRASAQTVPFLTRCHRILSMLSREGLEGKIAGSHIEGTWIQPLLFHLSTDRSISEAVPCCGSIEISEIGGNSGESPARASMRLSLWLGTAPWTDQQFDFAA